MYDARSNFAQSTIVTTAPSTAGVSFILLSASDFPDPAVAGQYNIVVKPPIVQPTSTNSEICRVTAKASNTLTVVRNQESSSNRNIAIGDEVFMGITAQMVDDITQSNWFRVTQASHGLAVTNAIYHNGTIWVKARSNAGATLGTHIVVNVPGANNFYATQQGRANIPSHGLIVGQYYYVSDTIDGSLTATEPLQFSNPLVYVESSSILHILPFRATEINQTNESQIGWFQAGETWTYAAADTPSFTFTISGDKTSKYSPGMRIRLTQTTVKYFIITDVTFSSPNTTITIYGGTDYVLANAAITLPSYSMFKTPAGFPASPLKWSLESLSTSNSSQSSPAQNTWYNLASLSLAIPVGVWAVSYGAAVYCGTSGSAIALDTIAQSTLSTANNTESDSDMTGAWRSYRSNLNESFGMHGLSRDKIISLTSKTTYYLNCRTTIAGQNILTVRGDLSKTYIRAVCLYL